MIKTCRICGECKDIGHFYNCKKEKDGLATECKACKKQIDRDYRKRNAESIAAQRKIYRENNKEKIKESKKRSVAKNKEHYERKRKEYAEEHREEKRIKANEYYWENKECVLEKQRKIRIETPQKHMLTAAKKRAKEQGMTFDLIVEDLIVPEICPILGIPLSTGNFTKEKQSPSLDRLDNSKGYTKENSWVISSLSNTMKSDASFEELILFAKWIVGESIFTVENQEVENRVLRRWYSGIKARCKRDGIIFDISPDDLYIPKVCPVFGKPLSKKFPPSSKMLPSVDRIVPENGYTRGNIAVISRQANTMKNRATRLELLCFAGWVFKEFAPDYLTQGATNAILIHTLMQYQLQEEAQKLL